MPRRLLRVVAYAAAAAIALFCVLLLAVRFVGLPQLERHRDDVAARLSLELGHPVEIDAIRTGWDGWNPRISVQGLRVRDAARSAAQALIELPEVSGTVSWTSLLSADLRLKELEIDRAKLAIRRDRAGRIHVAGLEIDPDEITPETPLLDWMLRQRLIVVRDALFIWNDDLRNAPQLILDNVQFRLENSFGQLRFGLTGTPPPEIAAPIEFRGELARASLDDLRRASGRMYLRLDYADVAAWSEWLPLPVSVASGAGAMRIWMEFAEGSVRDAVADLELAEVRTRLREELPPLDLARLAGRITWQQHDAKRAFATRGLWFVERGGAQIAPTDLSVRYTVGPDGENADGQIVFNRLDLAPLALLAAQLPLPSRFREDLVRYQPRGTLHDGEYVWEGEVSTQATFKARASFADLGIRAFESMPGLTGLSGRFEATQDVGSVALASRDVVVTLPKVLSEPIALDTAAGRVRWERRADGVSVRLDDVEYANAHAAGTAQGSWRSRPKGPGEVDLTARLSRGDVREAHRYLPLSVDPTVRAWVRGAVLRGQTNDVRLTLKGDLARFPFADGRSGTFVVAIKGTGAALDYADHWPRVEEFDADVRFEGSGVTVIASRGRVLGATLGRTTATIPDLSLAYPVLSIEGEATGPTTEFLALVDQSPIADWIEHFTDGASVDGQGRLALKLAWALGKPDEQAKVQGDYQISDNEIRLPGVPKLAHVSGNLAFTERELTGRDLSFEAFGGSARASITSQGGVVQVSASGNANLAAVKQAFEMPFADRIAGTTDWQLELHARREFASWTLASSLRGVAIDLPAPLGKTASEQAALKIERRALANTAGREAWIVDYGGMGRVVAHRRSAPGSAVDRMLVTLGKPTRGVSDHPERSGLVIRGHAAALNLDEWLALSKAATSRDGARAEGPELESLDVEAGEFIAFGRRYDDMKLSARRSQSTWRLKLAPRQAEGAATWESADSKHANGRFSARLTRLHMAAMGELKHPAETARREPALREGAANPWPELDVTADRFIARAGDLGRLELAARPDGTDWQVTRLAIVNDAGRIDASGRWKLVGSAQQTELDVKVDVDDTPAYLKRVGLPADVKGAPSRLTGRLRWPGTPTDFAYETLSGEFKIESGAGQFTKLDPGVGKLLGVLSLQALPRRISLDFRDVFSEGFAFDTLAGTVRIEKGILHTDDLALAGPAAKVQLAGSVDLASESQALRVRVQPSLSTTVSAGAGAAAVVLLAANPLIGAAVGAGTLIAQKIMQDPIEQMFSYEYAIRGSWTEPVVERVAAHRGARFGEAAKDDQPATR